MDCAKSLPTTIHQVPFDKKHSQAFRWGYIERPKRSCWLLKSSSLLKSKKLYQMELKQSISLTAFFRKNSNILSNDIEKKMKVRWVVYENLFKTALLWVSRINTIWRTSGVDVMIGPMRRRISIISGSSVDQWVIFWWWRQKLLALDSVASSRKKTEKHSNFSVLPYCVWYFSVWSQLT